MKVLHVCIGDAMGGAAIAASRLHEGLLAEGVDSIMLVERKSGRIPNVEWVETGFAFLLTRVKERLISYLSLLQRDDSLFVCSLNLRHNHLIRRIDEIAPDIVHLHWVGLGMLRIEDLPKIRQPIVWTLHDMWAFCGSEHCNLDQGKRWAAAYAKDTRFPKARGLDLTRMTWLRKAKAWRNVELTTISPSTWMQGCAATSSLWKENPKCRHVVIPNGLNTEIFKPTDRNEARRTLGIPDGLPLLVFGAVALNSKLKGADLLQSALQEARKRFAFRMVTFGHNDSLTLDEIEKISFGSVQDKARLAMLYSAADVVLVPSRMESFGQVASEALSCGTPVVCFDTSGLTDIVDHKVNGYRASAFNVKDFAEGIAWCADPSRREVLSRAARAKAVDRFDIKKCVTEHISLYREILSRKR